MGQREERATYLSAVKLHLTRGEGRNHITGSGLGYVSINGARHEHSLIVTPEQVLPWPVVDFRALNIAAVARLLELAPEVALIGTGASLEFPPSALLRPLIDARVGYEIMDTAAACRTYAILMAEGRRVLAALIV